MYQFADPAPYEHQKEALRKLVSTEGRTALLMDPGTGKTRVVVDYMSFWAHLRTAALRCLVVAPTAALDTWVTQVGEYTPDGVAASAGILTGSISDRAQQLRDREEVALTPSVDWAVVNLESFSRKHAAKGADGKKLASVTVLDRMVKAVQTWDPHALVIDESHRIKSPNSNVSKAMERLSQFISHRILLTGTVMPHSPMDVYAQWRVLNPEAFSTRGKAWNMGQWKSHYAIMGGWMGKEVVGWKNMDDMEQRMAENAIVVRKSEALDLPPTTDSEIQVSLSPREQAAYDKMEKDLVLADGDESITVANMLVRFLRLRQITSGFLKVDDTGEILDLGFSKAKLAVALMEDLILSEDRIVVFGHFVAEVNEIFERSKSLGAEVNLITGKTHPLEREKIRKHFGSSNPNKQILVCQVRTMSLAVNELVTSSHAIYASMSERRDDYIQSRDRLDRIGQTLPVTFHHLVAPGTVDGAILKAHRERTNMEKVMLEYVRRGY